MAEQHPHRPQRTASVATADSGFEITTLTRAKSLIFLAAGLSFLMSVYLYFGGEPQRGIFVGLWVPSILSAGTLLIAGERHE
jgi:hypothetical protein